MFGKCFVTAITKVDTLLDFCYWRSLWLTRIFTFVFRICLRLTLWNNFSRWDRTFRFHRIGGFFVNDERRILQIIRVLIMRRCIIVPLFDRRRRCELYTGSVTVFAHRLCEAFLLRQVQWLLVCRLTGRVSQRY